jgi:hypothetical protein
MNENELQFFSQEIENNINSLLNRMANNLVLMSTINKQLISIPCVTIIFIYTKE